MATITAASTALAASTVRTGLAVVLFLVDPAFDADNPVNGAGFCETVVEWDTQRLERHFAFAVALCTGDISTTEASTTTDADAFGTEFHGGLEGALHGAAEGNPALKLDCDLLGNELSIEFRLANFENVEFYLGFLADLLDLIGHDLDLLALASDDETGAGRVEGNADTVPSTLNNDAGEAGVDELVLEICADGKILVELVGIVFAAGIPFGTPVFVDGEAEGDRIYFLAHGVR